jgi:integrase
MFTWAIKRGYFELNPLDKIERLEEIEWVGERPEESTLDTIFAKLSPRTVPVFMFLRETGCRRGEAITLTWSQLDRSRECVIFHFNTENGKSRQVPLTQSALDAVYRCRSVEKLCSIIPTP